MMDAPERVQHAYYITEEHNVPEPPVTDFVTFEGEYITFDGKNITFEDN